MSDAPSPPGSAESDSWNGREVWLLGFVGEVPAGREQGAGGGSDAARCAARGRGGRREEPEKWVAVCGRSPGRGRAGGVSAMRRESAEDDGGSAATRHRSAGGLPTGSWDGWCSIGCKVRGRLRYLEGKTGKRKERMTLRCLQDFMVVIFRATDHLSQRPSSTRVKTVHLGATPILPLTEYQELELGKMYFNQRVPLFLVHLHV